MRSDAYMMFTCDDCHTEEEEVTLPVVCLGGNIKGPHCDLRTKSLDGIVGSPRLEDWTTKNEKDYCPDCSEKRKCEAMARSEGEVMDQR